MVFSFPAFRYGFPVHVTMIPFTKIINKILVFLIIIGYLLITFQVFKRDERVSNKFISVTPLQIFFYGG